MTDQPSTAVQARVRAQFDRQVAHYGQASAMAAFMLTQDEAGLFGVAGAFGVGFSALIPAYVLAIRELYPASEASWRVPGLLLFSGSGMAAGSWLAGVLYDYFGYYAPAFAAGVGTNVLNILVIGALVARQRYADGRPAMA